MGNLKRIGLKMDELTNIFAKYKDLNIPAEISDSAGLQTFSLRFYKDVINIYDIIARMRNIERNPTGFDFNDAAVLGLLIRICKIFKEVVYYYENNNGDIITLLDRQIIESAVTAKYLLLKGDAVIEDYRKCSYKDRYAILIDHTRSPDFFQTVPGLRLKESINQKLKAEGFTLDSFKTQIQNKWKLEGKSFYQIFSEVEPKEFYKYLYGITSEAIHGSWNESLDFNLAPTEDGKFLPYLLYQPVDIRFVTPLLKICNDPYLQWLDRIDVKSEYFLKAFRWIASINTKLYDAFEAEIKRKGRAYRGIV